MKFKSFLTSMLFLVATVFTAHAQNSTISGKVSDGVENLNGVNLVSQGTSACVVSDNNGFFSISSDKELPWTLEFSSLGYSSQSLIVSSNSQVISVTLVSGEPLEEVVVSGSRKPEKVSESVASITTINLKEIERRPTFNAANLLDNIVGVQVDKQGANRTNITLRDQVDIFSTSTLVMLDYRDLSQVGLNIFVLSLEGENDINLKIAQKLNKYKDASADKKHNIKVFSNFEKKSITKNEAGNTTNFRLVLDIDFIVIIDGDSKTLNFVETFDIKENEPLFEQSNYEREVKNDMINLIIQKFTSRLLTIKW